MCENTTSASMIKIAIKRKFYIIHTMYYDYDHLYIPAHAQKLYKILNYR